MCTLTIIPLWGVDNAAPSGYRVVTNRDESVSRPSALPPALTRASAVRAAWPIDSLAGGTWVGANERGLVLSLLNLNLTPPPALPPAASLLTRGAVIPALMDAASAQEAVARLADSDLAAFAPFRLVAVDRHSIVVARWDRSALAIQRRPLAPACYVSSGLGDETVAARLALFDGWFAGPRPTPEEQDAFHEHVWPDRPEISVRMSRRDARTVSTTSVEVVHAGDAAHVAMDYRDDAARTRVEVAGGDYSLAAAPCGPRRC